MFIKNDQVHTELKEPVIIFIAFFFLANINSRPSHGQNFLSHGAHI